jgi:glutamyl-tRNA synthetase
VRFRDGVHGEQRFHPSQETGDFVVRRRDGVAAYQLAVAVDDAAMRITDVVRGDDLLPSTARQILLYGALGRSPPAWLHVPLLLGADGERLAKRHGAVGLGELRATGVRPERIVGWLAASCGLAEAGEAAEPRELVGRFLVAGIPRGETIVGSPPVVSSAREPRL